MLSKKIVAVSLLLCSLLFIQSCENKDPLDNTRTYIKGSVLNRDGTPVVNQRIKIDYSFDSERTIGSYVTDANGVFEGAGFVYNGGDYRLIMEGVDHINYEFAYSNSIAGRTLQLPQIEYADLASILLEVNNTSGNELTIRVEFIDGYCDRFFMDGVEQAFSSCFENRAFTFIRTDAQFEISQAVIADSNILINITDGNTTVQQSINVNQNRQVEVINFN